MSTSPAAGQLHVALDDDALVVSLLDVDGARVEHRLDVGVRRLTAVLGDDDPPEPETLTNAVGAIADHLDDLVRIHDHLIGLEVHLVGPDVAHLATVEVGHEPAWPYRLDRPGAEEIFRTLATETRAERRHNPGLAPEAVDRIVAVACATVGVMRRLHCQVVTVHTGEPTR